MYSKSEKLQQVKEKFANWRATRTKRGPLPKELWEDAVNLASDFSTFKISKSLRINYAKLKKLIDSAGIQSNLQKFVQLEVPAISNVTHQVSLELRNKNIELHIKSNDSKELVQMTIQFLKNL